MNLDLPLYNLSNVCCGPILLLFVVVVLLLGDNSIGCNVGGFATSSGADSIFYTYKKKLYEVRN